MAKSTQHGQCVYQTSLDDEPTACGLASYFERQGYQILVTRVGLSEYMVEAFSREPARLTGADAHVMAQAYLTGRNEGRMAELRRNLEAVGIDPDRL